MASRPLSLDRRALLPACLFLSGAAALMEEVIWEKYLAVHFGSTAVSRTLILTGFMGGLSLGYLLAGRASEKLRGRVKVYAGLELLIGLYAAASPLLFSALDAFQRLAAGYAGADGPTPRGLVAAALLIVVPTALMGATLPVLAPEADLGALYAANNFGGLAGALGAAFLLLPALGLDASVRWAGAFNLLAAGLATAALRLPKGRPHEAAARLDLPGAGAATRVLVLAGAFVAGLCALAQEHVWTRFLGLVLGSSTHTFALVLAAYIAGLGWGAWRAALWKPERPARAFGLCLAASGAAGLFAMTLASELPRFVVNLRFMIHRSPDTYPVYAALAGGGCLIVLLGPAFFSGLALPLAAEAVPAGRGDWGRTVGTVFGLNTLGAIVGAAAAGLGLLPWAGVEGALLWTCALPLAAGTLLLVLSETGPRRWPAPAAFLAAAGVLFALRPRWTPAFLAEGAFDSYAPEELMTAETYDRVLSRRNVLYYKDGADASVAVLGDEGRNFLKINGKTEASALPDLGTQVVSGHLPFVLFPEGEAAGKQALVIGLGSGNTLGAVLKHPVTAVDMLEISPEVVAASRWFEPGNGRPLEDPRVTLRVADAAPFLRLTKRSWDFIISEPSNPWVAGVAGLFTQEFFQAARSRLKPGGAMLQWFHLYNMDNESLRIFLRTFASVFPAVTVWNSEGRDLMIVGSEKPLAGDWAAMQAVLGRREVREDLARPGLRGLESLLSLQVLSEADMADYLAEEPGPVHTDRHPLLEYLSQRAHFSNETADALNEIDGRRRPAALGRLLLHKRRRDAGPPTLEELRAVADYHNLRPGISKDILLPGLAYELARRGDPAGHDRVSEWLFFDKEPRAAVKELEGLLQAGSRRFEHWSVYADKKAELEYKTLCAYHEPPLAAVLDAYQRLVELDPKRSDSYDYRRGKTLLAWGRPGEAVPAFERALRHQRRGVVNLPAEEIKKLLDAARLLSRAAGPAL